MSILTLTLTCLICAAGGFAFGWMICDWRYEMRDSREWWAKRGEQP